MNRVQLLRCHVTMWRRYGVNPIPMWSDALHHRRQERIRFEGGELAVDGLNVDLLSLFKEIWIDENYCPDGFGIMPGETVLDIGANIGVFATYAAWKGAGRVVCYEPMIENCLTLARNVERCRMTDRIIIHQSGILSTTGTHRIYLSGSDSGNLMFHRNIGLGLITEFIEVPVTSLEEAFADECIDHCGLLKLDCEGAEYDILLNGGDAVIGRVGRITMEIHNNVDGHDVGEIKNWLESRGFECRHIMLGDSAFGYLWARR